MANKLKIWRIERGLSQHELAQASGVGRWAIQLFEVGIRYPTPSQQLALCEALGVSVGRIFTNGGQKDQITRCNTFSDL